MIVKGAKKLKRFYESAKTRRVDAAIISDSNTIKAVDSGLREGWVKALSSLYGLYGTGVYPANGGGQAADWKWSCAGDNGLSSTAPASHAAYAITDPNFIPAIGYKATGSLGANYLPTLFGLEVNGYPNSDSVGAPFATEALNWRVGTGTFSTGSGQIALAVRYASTLNYLNTPTAVATNTGVDGLSYMTASIPAGVRDQGVNSPRSIWFTLQKYEGDVATIGPFYIDWMRLEVPTRLTGIAVSTLLYQGGKSTRDAAIALKGLTQSQFNAWLRMVVGFQNATPMILFKVCQGQNDSIDSNISEGPNPTLTNTPAGVCDNTDAVITRLRTLWTGAGYSLNDIYFQIGPYHPQDESRPTWGPALDIALGDYFEGYDNVGIVSRTKISSSSIFRLNDYYENDVSDSHLRTRDAYERWVMQEASMIKYEIEETDGKGQLYTGGIYG